MREIPLVLQLDVAGNPHRWITYEDCAYYYSKGLIAWSMGEIDFTLYGGVSRMTGEQSALTMNTIVAIKGKVNSRQWTHNNRVSLSNRTLFRRDKNTCAYCGNEFQSSGLTRDHVMPTSRNGPNTWTNVVTACPSCNKHKDARTPEEAGMDLLYVPYTPNRAEYLILSNRRVLADQMEFLLHRVSPESRLLE